MTVYELIIHLKKLPMNAKVFYSDGEYKDSTAMVNNIKYQKDAILGQTANSVIIS